MAFRRSTRSAARVLVLTTLVLLLTTASALASDGTFLRDFAAIDGSRPVAVDVDAAGNAYVSQIGSGFNRVQKFDSTGASIFTVTGFSSPRGVAVAPSGTTVYVADFGAGNVKTFPATGGSPTVWGTFTQPDGIAVDAAGNVFVAERGAGRISKRTSAGVAAPGWPVGGVTGFGTGNLIDVAVDSASNTLYVTNRGAGRIHLLDATTGDPIEIWEGITADGISVDSAGFVYVAQSGANTARKFDSSGAAVLSLDLPAGFSYNLPRGIAVDSADNVYVTNLGPATGDQTNQRVFVFGTEDPPPVVSTSASAPWSIAVLVAIGFAGLYATRRRMSAHSEE